MLVVSIMREMGWTYEEYLSQPIYIIDLLKAQLEIEAQRQATEDKKRKR
jgi:hypothetical protein